MLKASFLFAKPRNAPGAPEKPASGWLRAGTGLFQPPPETPSKAGLTFKGAAVNCRKRSVFEAGEESNYGIPLFQYRKSLDSENQAAEEPTTTTNCIFDNLVEPSQPRPKKRKRSHKYSRLLSDKYAPTDYWNLSLTENSNVKVRKWLGAWMQRINNEVSAFDSHGKPESASKFTKHFQEVFKRDMLLVHGPPGTGKTLSLRVISEELGYRVHHFDCSELSPRFAEESLKPVLLSSSIHDRGRSIASSNADRTIQVFGGRYEVEYKKNLAGETVIARDERPSCIIIDGIDLASPADFRSFLKSLDNLVKSGGTKHKRPKKPDGRQALLTRPIVFVSSKSRHSNVYELRSQCYGVEMAHLTPSALREYLAPICEREGVSAMAGQLEKLAVQMNCDIRACLNTIQTFKGGDLMSLSIDSSIDAVGFASRIFSAKDRQSAVEVLKYGGSDLESLISAIFTQYLHTGSITLRPWLGTEWLQLADWASRLSFRDGSDLDQYLQAAVLAFSNLFPSAGKLPIRRSENTYETRITTKSIIERAFSRSCAGVRRSYSSKSSLMELYPYILQMSEAGNTEADAIAATSESLVSAGVTIKKTLDLQQPKFYLEPDISLACQLFPDLAPVSRAHLYEKIKNETFLEPQFQRGSANVRGRFLGELSLPKTAPKPAVPHSFIMTQASQLPSRSLIVWLDYKLADENAARRPVTWLDIFT